MILMLKYIPIIISLFYIINTTLSYFYIDIPIISNIAEISLLPWLFMYISAVVFKFCSYHKMFLYYILIIDLLNIADYYFNIPIKDLELLMIHVVITGISLLIILYLYVKSNKRFIVKNNR